VALLRPAAERYVVGVLCVADRAAADELVGASVARALRTLPRDLGPDELTAHVHAAVRHEAWKRQEGGRTTTRLLAAAALVLVLLAMGAVAVAVGRALDGPGEQPSAVVAVSDAAVVVDGRVVDTTASGTVLGGRPDVEVSVVADGDTVGSTTTDASGRFEVAGLAPGAYEIRVDVPDGLRLRGAADGRSTSVDLTERSVARVVLELQRS
jgi:hypothetical protein